MGGYLVAVVTVATAAREKPALERSGRRKAEANSLAVLHLYTIQQGKERRGLYGGLAGVARRIAGTGWSGA
ncbi:hypothetical protein IF2G_02645 [Cordyceps javanica]|nr:hypothetical protein IF2G_02645 [Cordyceps javanica]